MDWTTIEPLHRCAERSATLPGLVYHDPTVFAEERDRIFARSWQLAGHRSQLPEKGDYLTTEVAGEPLFVIRSGFQQLRAFYNVCRHRAHPVVVGRGRSGIRLVCPYHAWTYNLDGSLAAARNTDALPDFDKSCYGLKPVRLEERLGFIFVNLDEGAPSLTETVGAMFDDMENSLSWLPEAQLDAAGTGSSWEGSDLAANWKVLSDNCRECYHCTPVHRDFVDLVDMETYRYALHSGWTRSEAALGKEDNSAYRVSRDEPLTEAIFWHMWPNMEFGILPGEESFGAFRFDPTSPERTRVTGLMLSGDGGTVRKDRLHYRWNVLWPEDEGICQAVHQGLKSRSYGQSRFVVDPDNLGISEGRVHAFQLQYADAMGLPVIGD